MSIPLNPKKQKQKQQQQGPKPIEDGGMENDYLCFALAIHTLNITCQYVMTVANMNPEASIVFMGISIVVTHAVLSELMLRGLKVRNWR